MGRIRLNLKGKEKGRLRFLNPVEMNRSGSMVWECVCAPDLGGCGKKCHISTDSYRSGTRSCGCLVKEALGRRKKEKKYDIEKLKQMRNYMTLEKMGEALGISKQRVFQIMKDVDWYDEKFIPPEDETIYEGDGSYLHKLLTEGKKEVPEDYLRELKDGET